MSWGPLVAFEEAVEGGPTCSGGANDLLLGLSARTRVNAEWCYVKKTAPYVVALTKRFSWIVGRGPSGLIRSLIGEGLTAKWTADPVICPLTWASPAEGRGRGRVPLQIFSISS